MPSTYQTSLINHLHTIERWAESRGATASIQIPGAVLRVQWHNRIFDFQPQFLVRKPAGGYTAGLQLSDQAFGFAGWLPYFNKRWDAGCGKLAFKQFAEREGVVTPAYSFRPGEFTDVLVKREKSSLGEGLRGPFRATSPELEHTRLREAEYYESFIIGKILKVLYWNARPVCVDLFNMATVTGDGRQTISELVHNKLGARAALMSEELLEAIVAYQGRSLDSILDAKESIVADCRFGSPLLDMTTKNENMLSTIDDDLRRQLESAGSIFERSIPDEFRNHTAFSVDGILAEDGTLWFLEMNCNPMLHPDIYPVMLDSLFSDADVIGGSFKPLHLQYDARATNPAIRYLAAPPASAAPQPSEATVASL